MLRCLLIGIIARLIASCGESETEALARETREREAAERQAWEERQESLQKAQEETVQGVGFNLQDR